MLAMLERFPGTERTRLAGAAVLTAAIFVADLSMGLGYATGSLYVFVVLLGLGIQAPWYPLAAAGTGTALLFVDTLVNWTAEPPATVFVNRPLLTLLLWVVATVVQRYRRIERENATRIRQLADLNYALDQSAIVATTDVTGRITYVNDKFCEISKYSAAELLGQDHRLVNSGTHPKAFIRELWTTIARGKVWHGELRNRAKDGSLYWVDTTIVPYLDDRGHPYQYTAIRSDITERKAMEARLREQAALARVGQMAAVVAHEVRNPLAGIKGAMQVLAARRDEKDPEASVMRDIVGRVDALSELVNDLLLFARPTPPRLARVDLAALVHEAAALVRRDPAAQRTQIVVEGEDAGDAGIEADAALVRALFVNLMLNSVQALQAARTEGGVVRLVIVPAAGQVQVSVRDNGPGIPEDVAQRMFEPFFTTKTRGGGLGLAIARRTAELHGGTLEHRGPVDGGTEMIVTLARRPIAARDVDRAATAHAE